MWKETHREKPKLNNQLLIPLLQQSVAGFLKPVCLKLVKTLFGKQWISESTSLERYQCHCACVLKSDEPVVRRSKTRGTPTNRVGFNSLTSSGTFLMSCIQQVGYAQSKVCCRISKHFCLLCLHSFGLFLPPHSWV
jgi:hypothetical protein